MDDIRIAAVICIIVLIVSVFLLGMANILMPVSQATGHKYWMLLSNNRQVTVYYDYCGWNGVMLGGVTLIACYDYSESEHVVASYFNVFDFKPIR